jgi:uncharacterized protein
MVEAVLVDEPPVSFPGNTPGRKEFSKDAEGTGNSGERLVSVHRIPVDKLSPEALQGVIEEFISREGTDYSGQEVPMETKVRYVRNKLETGSAVLIFDDKTETTNIFLANDPVLRKLDEFTL